MSGLKVIVAETKNSSVLISESTYYTTKFC